MTPQKVQKNIHNFIIPQNIFIFSDPPPLQKNEIQNLNLQKWARTTYIWSYKSTNPRHAPKKLARVF